MKNESVTRDLIVRTLVEALEPLHFVHAFWEGGAAAFDRIDEWSDIDLYLVVDDDMIDETFFAFENALKSISSIQQKYEVSHRPETGVFQAFYRLADTNQYLIIDLAILKQSSPDKYLEEEIHGKAAFYFNKSDKVKPPPLDKEAFLKKLRSRLERLNANFDMFNNFVQKEICRGNYLEAIGLYHALTLATLVEALRIRYNPVHHDFRMRYVHYELPLEVIKRLKPLYFVKDEDELKGKYCMASEWFHELIIRMKQEGIKWPTRKP